MTQGASSYARGTILGLRPGQIVDGRLEILNLIGYGGQGVVLKVKHLEWGRYLALKLPLPEVVQSPVNRERYLQEAETWIRMGVHPHVVRCWFVHNINGLPGLFLDLITGGSLDDRIKEGEFNTIDWSKILKILLQITDGLTHSHTMGVVHRDLKPENILIREDGSVCLTDFGLVKSFDDPNRDETDPNQKDPESSSVTGTGQFVGTPRYGAPEQWNKDLKITPATDIYALGVIFYEMACGRRPFDAPGEDPDPLTLIHRHLKDPPPDPRTFRQNIPDSIAEIIMHCLAKNHLHRPQSSEQMIDILSGLLKHQCGEDYHRSASVPEGEKPDLLNNAAVSLYSLGKVEKSRELLRRGLLLQAGHPECLYNLVQLDKREGKITSGEALRILRRSKAKYQMALLCIEEGLGKQAIDLLGTIPDHEKNGRIYRIEGDALMYAKQYLTAQRAYERATSFMPHDLPTRTRKILASQGSRSHEGHVYFPSSHFAYQNRAPGNHLYLTLSANGEVLIGITPTEVVTINLEDQKLLGQCPRSEQASPVKKAWVHKHELLIQDHTGFEMWSVVDCEPLKRQEGRVLAASTDLTRLVVLKSDGVFLVDKKLNQANCLQFPPGTPKAPYVQACFTPDQAGLCIMTPGGQIAQVDAEYRVVPLAWPPALPKFQEVCSLQLSSKGLLYVAWNPGNLQAINLGTRAVEFSLKLPYRPESLTLDASEEHLIVSSPTEFGVLKRNGKIALRGKGPCSTDPTRKFAMAWAKGYLSLYNLSPFRRVRTWADKIEQPVSLRFAANGSSAVSMCRSGEHHVWEVDEPNRVFERDLLLTPGESYEQLIRSYESYLHLFEQARRLVEKKRYFDAYQTLKNARGVPGFLQAPEALEVQWKLAAHLKRFALEAIWERLYTDEVHTSALSDDNDHLLLAGSREWTVREFGSAGGAIRLTRPTPSLILGSRYITVDPENPMIVTALESGSVVYYRADDGTEVHKQDLGLGPLVEAKATDDSIFVWSESGCLGFFDISSMSLRCQYQLEGILLQRAFPLSKDRVFIITERGPAVVDLKKGKVTPGLPVALTELPGEPTFAADQADAGVVLLGFSDGTLYVANNKNGKILFAVNHKKGAIRGACLDIAKGIGVSVTHTGRLCVFDLARGGEPFELFTAHSEPIISVRLSSNARYISTRTRSGQFRFWELSWTFSEETGDVSLDWLPTGTLSKLGRLFKFS